ncbi:MAG TPA: DUF481 domain-containing protein [Acidobacteriaceae bacterium]|nr:DUF481 domain-containing protein [Acidobacteriaceae bacterium]
MLLKQTLRSAFIFVFLALFALVGATPSCAADSTTLLGHTPKPAPKAKGPRVPPPDVIVFTNGDQLTGVLLREVGGKVTFHSEILGDVTVPWSVIKSLRTKTQMAVLEKNFTPRRGQVPRNLPVGAISVSDNLITVHPANHAMIKPIPVKNAQYLIDQATLSKQLYERPGFFAAWNGAVTAGATIVQATQKQYTFNGAIALNRTVPTLPWLNTVNRTTLGFSGSYGKITQPAYTSEGVFYPSTNTKSAIYHADAERDEYFSPRFYALAQTSFDHNYSQGLDLQQIYGVGIGDTVMKRPKQILDFKATIQYENQAFINATSGINQNLIGSTFAGVYSLKLPRGVSLNQQVAYIPGWNNLRAYSATESNTVGIPFYKSLSFSVGTIDSYLNNPPPAVPPTQRNSFQFNFGATYQIKSHY